MDTPYERQTLADYITYHARTKGAVRVMLHGQEWSVQATETMAPCARCGSVPTVNCLRAQDDTEDCLDCVLHLRSVTLETETEQVLAVNAGWE